VVWEEIAGTSRAKWLLWTREQIDAQSALHWGVVSEIVPHARTVDRGIEIARSLAATRPARFFISPRTVEYHLTRFSRSSASAHATTSPARSPKNPPAGCLRGAPRLDSEPVSSPTCARFEQAA
jgi:enoyl-CoA hydratase/carnithine racemase